MKVKRIFSNAITIFILLPIVIFISYNTVYQSHFVDNISNSWVQDDSTGTYTNPIIYADFSDPDVIRVDDNFYMTASSFNCVPGLPILHSKDLVNWKIISYALQKLYPPDVFNTPQHGNGVWAPSIRYRNGEFYIYYGDPDFGIYLVKAKNPIGPWSEPLLVKEAKGWIDPCPFWDDDGNAYLVHAYAGSRAGIKSVLKIHRMNSEGTSLLDDAVLIFDGHDDHPTIEGPKMYKRGGYYYIFAPAGGVKTGWQTVLRSKNIFGPYEDKIVMDQGNTSINGPHQGAWIELASGESWFIHFQDKEAYGRIVHLQPMNWINGWPVIGIDKDGDGKGEPVKTYRKPIINLQSVLDSLQTSDEFNDNVLGLQWQWHANPEPTWGIPFPSEGVFRLYAVPLQDVHKNFWDVQNLLLQKLSAPEFTAKTKVKLNLNHNGEKAGLIVMGSDYSYISVKNHQGKLYISQVICKKSDSGAEEEEFERILLNEKVVFLNVSVNQEAVYTFSYSTNGEEFNMIGTTFKTKPGKWIGAKLGLFCVRRGRINDSGYVDFDWFRVVK